MIAHKVLRRYVEEHPSYASVTKDANKTVADVLKKAKPDILPQATEKLYGWSVEEFAANVLYPEAFLTALQKEAEKQGEKFEEFVLRELNNASVKLYFQPWQWKDGKLVDR